jgi:hypothetical protein
MRIVRRRIEAFTHMPSSFQTVYFARADKGDENASRHVGANNVYSVVLFLSSSPPWSKAEAAAAAKAEADLTVVDEKGTTIEEFKRRAEVRINCLHVRK